MRISISFDSNLWRNYYFTVFTAAISKWKLQMKQWYILNTMMVNVSGDKPSLSGPSAEKQNSPTTHQIPRSNAFLNNNRV